MSKEENKAPAKNIQWLCRDCYEKWRSIPSRHREGRGKYNVWEAGRWQKDGECAFCHQWKQLALYEWEDTDSREYRRMREKLRARNYAGKKDTRAYYRGRWDET